MQTTIVEGFATLVTGLAAWTAVAVVVALFFGRWLRRSDLAEDAFEARPPAPPAAAVVDPVDLLLADVDWDAELASLAPH